MNAATERRRTPWPPWAHPAIVILVITGWFHFYRGAPVDGVMFLGAGCWLALIETRAPAVLIDEPAPSWSRRSTVVAVLLVTAVLTTAPRYGRVDVMVVGLLGIAAVLLAVTRGDVAPPVRRGAAWPYAVVGLVAALNELTAYLLETSPSADRRHPAISDLMDPVFAWPPTRGLLVLVWLAGGAWLLRMLPARAPRTSPETADLPWDPT